MLMTQAKGFVSTIKTMLPDNQAKASSSEVQTHLLPHPPQPSTPASPQPSRVVESRVQHAPTMSQQPLQIVERTQAIGGEDIYDVLDGNASHIRLFGIDQMKEVSIWEQKIISQQAEDYIPRISIE